MKRFLTRIIPVLLPACMVDTSVVKPGSDSRSEDLGAWCDSACARADECGINEDAAACPRNCVDSFNRLFSGNTAICTAAEQRVRDCIDEASCDDLALNGACNTEAEGDRCALSLGKVICRDAGGSEGGAAGLGGSAGVPGGGAGGISCGFEFSSCADDQSYSISCMGPLPPMCECRVDDVFTRSFESPTLGCPSAEDAIQACGWRLVIPE